MMMKKYNQSVEINQNPNWPYIPDHSYRILIVGGSGSGKTNVLLNLIKNQRPDTDKIYLFFKDPFESKYQLLTNGRENIGIKKFKSIIDYSQTINPSKKWRVLIVFDNLISDMEPNQKLSPIVTELFLRGKKLNISIMFISESYFKLPKTIRIITTHYFIIKIPNK